MTELGRARAVIAIWTDTSIKSDWVRSEAGRAQADRKLIPVKLAHLDYKALPPPFDVLHTENVGEEDKIKAAVVAQLAKPAVEPSPWALLTKGFRYEVLTWVGIIGGALTLFTNLGAVLKLADWARVFVSSWKEWTQAFWLWAFGWLGIQLPPEWPPVITFLSFGSLLAIGQAVKFKSTIKNQPNVDKSHEKSFRLISWRTVICIVLMLAVAVFSPAALAYLLLEGFEISDPVLFDLFVVSEFIVPPVILVLFSKHRLYAALSAFLISVFFNIIVFRQLTSMLLRGSREFSLSESATFVFSPLIMMILLLILLSVAPAKAVSRRLIFLALGLLLLIALNELSKLGFDPTAPKLTG